MSGMVPIEAEVAPTLCDRISQSVFENNDRRKGRLKAAALPEALGLERASA